MFITAYANVILNAVKNLPNAFQSLPNDPIGSLPNVNQILCVKMTNIGFDSVGLPGSGGE
jgi:hypothetical protein